MGVRGLSGAGGLRTGVGTREPGLGHQFWRGRSREKVGGHEAPASALSMAVGCLVVLAAANKQPHFTPVPCAGWAPARWGAESEVLLSGRSLHRETDAEPGRVLLAANGGVVPTGRNEPRPSPALLGARRGGLRLRAAARAGRALAVRGAGLFPHALPCGVSFRVADPRCGCCSWFLLF